MKVWIYMELNCYGKLLLGLIRQVRNEWVMMKFIRFECLIWMVFED